MIPDPLIIFGGCALSALAGAFLTRAWMRGKHRREMELRLRAIEHRYSATVNRTPLH